MIIQINENYRLVPDPDGWIAQNRRMRRNPSTGTIFEIWVSSKLFAKLDNALADFIQSELQASNAVSLLDVSIEIKKLTTRLLRALTPEFNNEFKVDIQ